MGIPYSEDDNKIATHTTGERRERLLTERETWSNIMRMRIFRSDKNGRLRISHTLLEAL